MTRRTPDARHGIGSGQLGVMTVALVSIACSTPRAPAPPLPSASAPPGSSAAPSPPASLAQAARRPPPEPMPDGCATAVPNGLAPVAQLEAIARACARGMLPLGAPRVGTLETGAALALPFTVTDASGCVRAAAAGSASIEELALEVRAEADPVSGADRLLGADQLRGALALANADGPICPPVAGKYRAIARVTRGRGEVAVQVWQAE